MSVKLQHIDTLNDQRKLDLQVSEGKETTDLFKLVLLPGYFSPVQLPAKAGKGPPRPVRRQQLLAE